MSDQIPTWEEFMIPTLQVMSDGVVRHRREFRPLIADKTQLSDEQRRELLPSGNRVKYENRIGWGVSFLTNVGALSRPKRGYYAITVAGKQLLSLFPDGARAHDIRALGEDPESPIRVYQKSSREIAEETPVALVSETDSMTPIEQVQRGVGDCCTDR